MDEHTQVVVLGTGDAMYEDAFRYYENNIKETSVHILPTMKMSPTIFMQDAMLYWYHQDLNLVDLHNLLV